MGSRIAIIGSGISGLGAAWALHADHEITVFEARDRLGGHSHTVDVATPSGTIPVDTGFIVYNEVTYPHLTRLFRHLGVETEASDMSFSFSVSGGVEYGASLRGLLAQPARIFAGRYRSMVRDIARFRRIGNDLLDQAADLSITELLEKNGFSNGFIDDYVLPMTGAIWSARRSQMRAFPASVMLRFLANHGLIEIIGRPKWRTVSGGSRRYVERLAQPFTDRIRLASPVTGLIRTPSSVTVSSRHGDETFDQVILATHTDQALQILGEAATPEESNILDSIRYESNRAYLHSDTRLMPRSRAAWSSWNSFAGRAGGEQRVVSVTYWMNRLQNLDPAIPLFVSLNPLKDPAPEKLHGTYAYSHPQFDHGALAAQHALPSIQGRNRTWFAGAYSGYGFHEDGLQSGFHIATALGSPPPWYDEVTPMSSSRPPLLPAET